MNSAPDAGRHISQFQAALSGRPSGDASETPEVTISSRVKPHYHRCARCRERMAHACIDPSCAEGYRWVIVCFLCYERMDGRGGW